MVICRETASLRCDQPESKPVVAFGPLRLAIVAARAPFHKYISDPDRPLSILPPPAPPSPISRRDNPARSSLSPVSLPTSDRSEQQHARANSHRKPTPMAVRRLPLVRLLSRTDASHDHTFAYLSHRQPSLWCRPRPIRISGSLAPLSW